MKFELQIIFTFFFNSLEIILNNRWTRVSLPPLVSRRRFFRRLNFLAFDLHQKRALVTLLFYERQSLFSRTKPSNHYANEVWGGGGMILVGFSSRETRLRLKN